MFDRKIGAEGSVLQELCRYVTDILKMCMKKFGAEKNFFDKLRGFLT